MNYFRDRIFEPIMLPLVAGFIILFGALNFSRLFLAAGGSMAVAVAGGISILILLGAVYATTRERIERGTLLASAAVLGVALASAGLLAQEVDLEHAAEHGSEGEHGEGVEISSVVDVVAIDIDFPTEQYEASPGNIEFNYVNEGETIHTLVVEGFEDELKLETPANGDTDSGILELDAGTFTLYCDVPGHRAAGMEAELTVEEGLGEAPEGGGLAGGEPDVSVPAVDIDFPQTEFEAAAGEVSIEYVNDGQTLHTLVIEGREEDLKLEVESEGDVDRGTIELEPGTFTLYCDVPGHRAAGMEGTLTVT